MTDCAGEAESDEADEESAPNEYPPSGRALENMLTDLQQNCRIPDAIPWIAPRDLERMCPPETQCRSCGGELSDPMQVSKAGQILDMEKESKGKYI